MTLVSPHWGISYFGMGRAPRPPEPGLADGRASGYDDRTRGGVAGGTGPAASRRPDALGSGPGAQGAVVDLRRASRSPPAWRGAGLGGQAGRFRPLLRAAALLRHPGDRRGAAVAGTVRREEVLDVGCGTGSGRRGLGAARRRRVDPAASIGIRGRWPRRPWTYRELGLSGRAVAARCRPRAAAGHARTAVMVAYAANELGDDGRAGVTRAAPRRARRVAPRCW